MSKYQVVVMLGAGDSIPLPALTGLDSATSDYNKIFDQLNGEQKFVAILPSFSMRADLIHGLCIEELDEKPDPPAKSGATPTIRSLTTFYND